MKRIFSILAVIFILLTGCNNSTELSDTPTESIPAIVTTETVTDTTEKEDPKGTTDNADAASSFSASKETETTEPEETVSETKPSVTTEQPAKTEKTETKPTTSTETTTSVTTTEPQETKPTETQPVKPPEEKIPETTKPETTVPSTEQTEPTEEPTTEPTTQAPETSEPPKAFNIDYWLNYAKNYAQSKGLVLDTTAVDCWDNPIRAGSHCIYLERDIQSRLNRYANDEDITDVWIWAESVGNDCYDIYIGYA